jgi:hypothetical protein
LLPSCAHDGQAGTASTIIPRSSGSKRRLRLVFQDINPSTLEFMTASHFGGFFQANGQPKVGFDWPSSVTVHKNMGMDSKGATAMIQKAGR